MRDSLFKPYVRRAYSLVSRSLYFPPLVVLAAILLITISPWQNARQTLSNNFQESINEKTQSVENKLKERFATYSSSLQNGVALLEAQPNLSSQQWHTYFESTEANTDRLGIQGTGYSKVFRAEEIATVQNFMSAQGINDFSVRPLSNATQISAVLYLYPQTNNNRSAIGFNMLSESTRRAAMERALNTGSPALTGKLTLVQDVKVDDGIGFLLYAPYFSNRAALTTKEQRAQNIQGYVYGGFRAKQLFSQLIEPASQKQNYSLKIYDQTITESNLLYQTKNTGQMNNRNNTTRVIKPVELFGRTWQFEFTFDNTAVVSRSERNAPAYILLVGVITAFLVFLALLSIFRSRAQELQLEKDKEVNLAKDELLSLASHQMRTPATGVKQYLGMVIQGFAGKLKEPQASLLEKAYTSNERQLHVINQILQLAKLESGRIVLAKHLTNLNELIHDIVDEQRDEVASHGHVIKLKLPKEPIVLKVDSHMVRMVIENLLSNAIKYSLEPGTIWVSLSSTTRSVIIKVKDNGIGIEEKQFKEIFKQFTRLYDEQAERISGTGVGLYLADQLVKLHKGKLRVASVVGEGSEFTVTLPKAKTKIKKE